MKPETKSAVKRDVRADEWCGREGGHGGAGVDPHTTAAPLLHRWGRSIKPVDRGAFVFVLSLSLSLSPEFLEHARGRK